MAHSIYKRLTGKRRGLASFSQLWLAPDHILLVRSSRITENYQRFFFSDIQSVVITSTPDRTAIQILGIIAALAWGALALAMDSRFGKGFFLVTGALLVIGAAVDLARGPRCRCTLYTAVSQEPLPPVSRQRIARRFLAVLQPAVEGVQGSLAPERLAQVPINSPEFQVTPPRLVKPGNRAAWILFSLLLLDSLLVWIGFRYSPADAAGMLPTAFFAEALLAVMVLIQDRANPRRAAYVLAAAALVCASADIYTTVPEIGRQFMAVATQGPSAGGIHLHFPNRVMYFALAWRSIGGLAGIAVLLLARVQKSAPPAPEGATAP